MRLRPDAPTQLTYCLNIHRGESWAESFAAVRGPALSVARRVAAGQPFGLGLRLSARAAAELMEPEQPNLRQRLQQLSGESPQTATVPSGN